MQIERLVQMVFYIVNHGHVTAKQLSRHFHVSTRTIYRDINTLTIAGIPILSAKGTGGGISLMDGYTIDKSLLSKEEQQSLFQGLQILQATKYPNAEMAMNKIGAVFRNAFESKWLDVDFSYWGSEETEKIKISDLQLAILTKHVITFFYFNSELKQSERTVEPLRLVFKSHAWYIVGYCRRKEELRIFRLSRIKHLQILPDIFERELPPDYSLTSECKVECHIPHLKLKFSPKIAHRLFDEFQEDQVCLCEDGNYYVSVPFALNNWTFHYLLSFGKYVEILEPEEARTRFKELATEIVNIYT
ncbi:MAG: YafY family transcriptional regulator [Lachnospiraceae bacterium]|jgi:predicted DNA-binding transcriptional regulator YafY|nr:YafY family transcriptional regulator [Lachnospiraceae bacterium]